MVQVGNELPELNIPITATLIAGGAFATGDWNLVHHDHQAALDAGTQDIFMNILTTNGLVGRYITDWAGPNARLTDVSIKLGASNFPGDTMRLSGKIEQISEDGNTVTVTVTGTNQLGPHVTGTATLLLDGRKES